MTELTSAPARQIGLPTAIALVMGNMIGSGVFLLPASLAAFGGMSFLGWGVSATGSVMLALVFARLARIDPAAGGPYAYTRRAFGDLAGFLVAWGYWISVWCANAALAVALVGYLDPFFPDVVRTPAAAAALAVAAIWLLTAVNILGVAAAGRVQLVTTVLKILPLAVVGFAGVVTFKPANFAIHEPNAAAFGEHLLATMTLTLWAFLGLECATVPAGSVRDPERTIARATIVGTVLAAVIYIVSTLGVMTIVAPDVLSKTTAPFADAARSMFGPPAAALVAAGAAISCFGALNGWILVVGQLPMAVARDGLFPAVFGHVSKRGTPVRGMLIAAVFSTVLVAMNYSQGLVKLFTFIILLSTLSTLVPYVFCSLAVFRLRGAEANRSAKLGAGAAITAGLAFVYALAAIGGAGADVVYWGFLLLLAGLPVFVWVTRGRNGAALAAQRVSEANRAERVGVGPHEQ